jgi:amidophosphoribosyltransferase
LVGARWLRDIEPGELLEIDRQGKMTSSRLQIQATQQARCVFELIYFARPDSRVFGEDVYAVRKAMGRVLASENPAAVDMVVPVPDSGIPAALGFAEESRIPFEIGLIRNHYIHRTFIEPDQSIRNFGVRVKLNPNRQLLKGKRVVIIDDSIVRGTTSKKIVAMVREAGATEVHMRVASPPIVGPCYFGIDTPSKDELIGAQQSVESIREFIQVDSLAYLKRESMLKVLKQGGAGYCTGCFTGSYPEPTTDCG